MKKHSGSAAMRDSRSEAASEAEAEATDGALMKRIGEGDLGPLGILYDRYHADVRQFIAHATSGGGDTEDLTHDTFLTLVDRLAVRRAGDGAAVPDRDRRAARAPAPARGDALGAGAGLVRVVGRRSDAR